MSIDLEIKEVKGALKNVGDDLRRFAEQAEKEVKNAGQMASETKKSVDQLLTEQSAWRERLSAMEQKVLDVEAASSKGGRGKTDSAGEVFAKSEEFKNAQSVYAKTPSWKGTVTVPVKNVITSLDSSGGAFVEPTRAPFVNPVLQRLVVRQLLAQGNTNSNQIEYVRETGFTNNAAPVSENPTDPKPESNIVYTLDNAPVVTIAHWIRASKQILADAGQMAGLIDGRLRYGLELAVEDQLLNGSGVGLNMDGLVNQATAYANPGVTVANETRIDRIRLAMLQVALAEYVADGIILNPIDWTGIELTKDAENRYIFTSPTVNGAQTLWGMPVVPTQSMAVGEYLTGAFRLGAQVWDREQANVQVSTEDRDNFVKNMVTILAETRLALTVYRPEAFVTGAFESGL
jgi:HK97 family phage major capsid protein